MACKVKRSQERCVNMFSILHAKKCIIHVVMVYVRTGHRSYICHAAVPVHASA